MTLALKGRYVHLGTFDSFSELTLSVCVNAMDLEHIFCEINANRCNSHIAPPMVELSIISYRWFRGGATIPL